MTVKRAINLFGLLTNPEGGEALLRQIKRASDQLKSDAAVLERRTKEVKAEMDIAESNLIERQRALDKQLAELEAMNGAKP